MAFLPRDFLVVRDYSEGWIERLVAQKGYPSVEIDYSKAYSGLGAIRKAVIKNDSKVLLYSRNETVSKSSRLGALTSELRMGYSSFSGIDRVYWEEQTRACLEDLLAGCVEVPFRAIPARIKNAANPRRTFSLVFDAEQLGGIRFGMPRVLALLAEEGVQATFFCTNFVLRTYSGLAEVIRRSGHEVGLHGLHHEYLKGSPFERQQAQVAEMKRGLQGVSGANFVGRMDIRTPEALAVNGLRYFVVAFKNTIGPLSLYCPPLLARAGVNTVWVAFIQAETYGKNWNEIKLQLDNTLASAEDSDGLHLTVLAHPFYDGALENLANLRRLVEYLHCEGFSPLRLEDKIASLPPVTVEPSVSSFRFELNPGWGRAGALLSRFKNNLAARECAAAIRRGSRAVLDVV